MAGKLVSNLFTNFLICVTMLKKQGEVLRDVMDERTRKSYISKW